MSKEQEDDKQNENPFPSLTVNVITKDYWFFIRMKSDIEVLERDQVVFKRFTESLLIVEFDSPDEARNYFSVLDNDENISFSIITDYSKV